jgi:cell division protein FtsX
MFKFMYSEFSRNISAYPWRSISFMLSFACTYFILIFTSFGIKNLFYTFETSTKSYEVMVILKPDTSLPVIEKIKSEIGEMNKDLTLKSLGTREVYEYMISGDIQKSIQLEYSEVENYIPKLIKVEFNKLSSLKKIVLATKIKNNFSGREGISDIATPFPKLHKLAELYLENRFGLFLFMATLYFSVFILLYLLLTLSLKEHKNKINLFRILGFKKNIIRWPLILEGTFLSLAGFIFAMSAMYSVYIQMNEEYSSLFQLQFFSIFEFFMHLILCVSVVFFLTTLLTQKIISDDFIEG